MGGEICEEGEVSFRIDDFNRDPAGAFAVSAHHPCTAYFPEALDYFAAPDCFPDALDYFPDARLFPLCSCTIRPTISRGALTCSEVRSAQRRLYHASRGLRVITKY